MFSKLKNQTKARQDPTNPNLLLILSTLDECGLIDPLKPINFFYWVLFFHVFEQTTGMVVEVPFIHKLI
jgi:hypothetical protein